VVAVAGAVAAAPDDEAEDPRVSPRRRAVDRQLRSAAAAAAVAAAAGSCIRLLELALQWLRLRLRGRARLPGAEAAVADFGFSGGLGGIHGEIRVRARVHVLARVHFLSVPTRVAAALDIDGLGIGVG
jgi:hypothetical protein